MITEWEIQSKLTARWAADGLMINDSLQFLVAWEVMFPSWRINDSKKYWSEPSIDFIFADKFFNFTAVELKRKVFGVKPCWHVLSQVTHRAFEIMRSISPENIKRAYSACWSGSHGRIIHPKQLQSLPEHHQEFFRLNSQVDLPMQEIRRCVAAFEFGPSWPTILSRFNQLAGDTLQAHVRAELTSKAAAREVNRLMSIPVSCLKKFSSPVISLELPTELL